jgi:poly-gamma-glutamate synthesis protein (capsule biosynthesis protein)
VGEDIRLVLAGDVMTGRGVDQILPHPGSADLHERYVHDARSYVALATRRNGPVPRGVAPTWPWGDALATMDGFGPSVRIFNLETSVTRSDDVAVGKPVTYRMSPDNTAVLEVARAHVWTLANNHVLDYGTDGLRETLAVLGRVGLRSAGAGLTAQEAWRPAVVRAAGRHVAVLSVADDSSGVPGDWAATDDRAGVALLSNLGDDEADAIAACLAEVAGPGDLRVVSIHWGSNWGYYVPRRHRAFAHRLVEQGVHLVHGHSSHHPRPVELYRGALVLYGCGDLVNDYEGIGGYEDFRGELRLLYLATYDAQRGHLRELRMVPLEAWRLSLRRAGPDEARWLATTLDRECRRLGSRVELGADGDLHLGLR